MLISTSKQNLEEFFIIILAHFAANVQTQFRCNHCKRNVSVEQYKQNPPSHFTDKRKSDL